MGKFRKQAVLLAVLVFLSCTLLSIFLLFPPKKQTAQAATYTITDGSVTDGSTKLSPADVLTISNGKITAVKSYGDFNPNADYFSVVVPSNVTSIGNSAFRGTNITAISFASDTTFTTIDDGTCTNPGSGNGYKPETSDGGAFSNCKSLSSVSLPTSITKIGISAFQGCVLLDEITIPKNIATVGYGAFANCTALEYVTFQDASASAKLKELTAVFYNCSYLRSVNVPNSVNTIGECTFFNCVRLTYLDLRNVTLIARGYDDPYAPFGSNVYSGFPGCLRLAEVHIRNVLHQIYKRDAATTHASYKQVTVSNYDSRYGVDRCILGGLLANVFNVVTYNTSGAVLSGSSKYVEKDGYVFVKNTGWATNRYTASAGTSLGTAVANLGKTTNYYATSLSTSASGSQQLTTTWNDPYRANAWYLVGYNGDGGYSNDTYMEFPSSFTCGSENVNEYYINQYAFYNEHAHLVKLSSAVLGIGDYAFNTSANLVFNMSAATKLHHIGHHYRVNVGSGGVIYLPPQILYVGHSGSNGAVPTHIIAPNRESYLNWSNTSYTYTYYCSFGSELTYIVKVNLYYPVAGDDNHCDVEDRLFGRAYNYVPKPNGQWATDDNLKLPKQQGYEESVWYFNKNGDNYSNKVNSRIEIDGRLSENVSEINLYARTVLRPDGSTPDGTETPLNVSYTYDGKSYGTGTGSGELNDGDFNDLFNAANSTYQLRAGSVAQITNFQPIYGTRPEILPTAIEKAGTYTLTVTLLSSYGEWSTPVTITVAVNQQEINLAEGAKKELVNGNSSDLIHLQISELLDGPVELNGENVPIRNKDGQYTAYNSVINNTGDNITLVMPGNSDYSGVYGITPRSGYTGKDPDVYTAEFDFSINANDYKFVEVSEKEAEILLKCYGIVVSVPNDYGNAASISKIWYIVGADNMFTNSTGGGSYNVFTDGKTSVVFGTENTLNVPDVTRKGDGLNVTFTLQIANNANIPHEENNLYTVVGTEGEVATAVNLAKYINSSMPVGSYRLLLHYPQIEATDTEPLCPELNARRDFTVTSAPITDLSRVEAVIAELTDEKGTSGYGRFDLQETSGVARLYDSGTGSTAEKITAMQSNGVTVQGSGIWADYSDCYGNVQITFNINAMGNNHYYAVGESELNAYSAPDTYTVYYQISAKNYTNLVNVNEEASRRNYTYTVNIYRLVSPISGVNSVTYTGGRVVPAVADNENYRVVWTEDTDEEISEPYVHVGPHSFALKLNDSKHYRWSDNKSDNGYSIADFTVTFAIVKTTNDWRYTPEISGWTYDGQSHVSLTAVAAHGTVTYEYYKAALNADGNVIENTDGNWKFAVTGNPLTGDVTDAGVYVLRASVAGGGDWNELFKDWTFTISKMIVSAPTLASKEYNGEKQTADIPVRDYYTDSGNDGWTDVNTYTIKLTLKNANYEWFGFELVYDKNTDGTENKQTLLLEFSITKISNEWVISPTVVSWDYGEFRNGKDISAGRDKFSSTVLYTVYKEDGETSMPNLSGFTLDGTGMVSSGIFDELNILPAGTYYLGALVEDNDNRQGIPFKQLFYVEEADNSWLKYPNISSWIVGRWSSTKNTPTAEPLHGTAVIVITDSNGKVYYSDNPDLQVNLFAENSLTDPIGQYTLTATVEGLTGQYKGIVATTIYFEIYASGEGLEANSWDVSPTIKSWTAGGTPEEPSGEPFRGKQNMSYTYYQIVVDEQTHERNEVELDEAPTDPGSYVVYIEVYSSGHRDYLTARLSFEIYERINYWTITPSIKDWYLSKTASEPVAQDAENGTIVFLYKVRGADDSTFTEVKPTTNGDYVMVVKSEAPYCSTLTSGYIEFSVLLETNTWERIPTIEDWSEEFDPNNPDAAATVGEVTYTYYTVKYDKDLKQYVRDKQLDAKPTTEGRYIVRATVDAYGYTPLEEEVEFIIEPAFDMTFILIDTALAVVAIILTVVLISIIVRRKNK